MPARFCAQCGTAVEPQARFCSACGVRLSAKGTPARPGGAWQITTSGATVLGFFLIAGLAIWTFILSPTRPRPVPGTTASRPGAPAETAAAMPEGHPSIEMPEEVRRFITDLDGKAAQEPENVATWLRLAQVKARASQIDPSYGEGALAAFLHVLEREPQNPDALQGAANVYYDRGEAKDAIRYYERYLVLRPDDAGSRTDLGTMYLRGGDETRAVATYQEVLRRSPSFLQAHYNLAITYHRQGDDRAALAELETARKLAPDDRVRRQIDEMVAAISGQPAPAEGGSKGDGDRTPPAGERPPAAAGEPAGTPFQKAVDAALRAHPILGPRIVRMEWGTPGAGRVLVRDFPMEAMPPVAREKFTGRLVETLRGARANMGVEGPVRLEVVDVATGRVMETVSP